MAHGLALDHAAWASPWRERSLRDKGVLSLGLLGSALALPPIPGGAAVALISVVLLVGPIKVGWGRLVRVVWLPVVSIAIGVATVAVSVGWSSGPTFAITPEGLRTARDLAVRSLAATLALFTLACSTPMIDLLTGLRKLRVPDPLIEIASLIYRFAFGLIENVGEIRSAQEGRLGYVDRRAAMRSASMAMSVLFLRVWERARRLDVGLAGRGYEDSLRTLEPPRIRSTAFLVGSLVLLAVLIGTSVMWGVLR